jgi:Sulfotransferase domain
MMTIRAAYRSVSKKLRRETLVKASFMLSDERRRQFERWLRGREEFLTLKQSDLVVVSCGKSGRTWLRTLLSRFLQLRYQIDTNTLINFDNYHYQLAELPRVTFTHDSYLKYYTGNFASKVEYRTKPTILMVRHPADVAVSQYFQWKHRILPRKKWLNEYPLHGADVSMFDLVMDQNAGVPYVVDFLNKWMAERDAAPNLFTLRYESLHENPVLELDRVLSFMGFIATPEELKESVRFGSFENMRKLETENTFFLSGRRLRKSSGSGNDVLKVRRGKANGWRDYFDAEQIEAIQTSIDRNLSPGLGYRTDEFPTTGVSRVATSRVDLGAGKTASRSTAALGH